MPLLLMMLLPKRRELLFIIALGASGLCWTTSLKPDQIPVPQCNGLLRSVSHTLQTDCSVNVDWDEDTVVRGHGRLDLLVHVRLSLSLMVV